MAEELGVDLRAVRGTGPAGRVTRRDVEEAHARTAGGAASSKASASPTAAAAQPARAEQAAAPAGNGASSEQAAKPQAARANGEDERAQRAGAHAAAGETAPHAPGVRRVPLSRMRASIAKRMAESK